MGEKDKACEQRRHERLRAEWPVVYKIGRNTHTGTTVNVSNEGILVESFLSSKAVSKILTILMRTPGYSLEVEYTCEGETYRRDAKLMHFHLDCSGREPYRFTVGFWIPKVGE